MPKIICNIPGGLTGQVGSVEFARGEAQVDAEHPLLEFFYDNPDRFEVHEDPEPETDPAEVAAAEAARLEAEQAETDRLAAELAAAQAAEADRLAAEQAAADAATNAPAPAEPDPYESLNVEQLRKAAKDAGLPVAGSKAELQARLRERDDNAKSEG